MVELVIFDADGVLFDSTVSNVAYYNSIFTKLGLPAMDSEEERLCVYYAATQVFARRAGSDQELLQRMLDTAKVTDGTPFFRLMIPALPLRAFMLELRRRYKIGLATNRSATVPALVEHLGLAGMFDAIASVLDNVAPKPAPDMLHLCLVRAQVPAERAVYVGDSSVDLEAAHAAGIRFIGVGARISHAICIKHLAELPAALKGLE